MSDTGGMAYVRNPGDLREALAALQHEIWAHWTLYQFSCCTDISDTSVCAEQSAHIATPSTLEIPGEKVTRWKRQANQHYDHLSEKERNSDREQADKILALFERPELLPALQALVLKLQKASAPFDLQRELTRLRRENDVDMVVNEIRSHWRVTAVQDTTFLAQQDFAGAAIEFDRAQVSEHDLQFLLVGAEFYVVSARESTVHGQTQHSERLIFVPTKLSTP
jgi:hypothetical protein